MALKGSLPEKASLSFRQALVLNPLMWEAFEGLCALGQNSFSVTEDHFLCISTRFNTRDR
jgi:hypothetical protein